MARMGFLAYFHPVPTRTKSTGRNFIPRPAPTKNAVSRFPRRPRRRKVEISPSSLFVFCSSGIIVTIFGLWTMFTCFLFFLYLFPVIRISHFAMIFNPFVLLLFLVAAEQSLTYSTWRNPRTVSSSSFVHPTSRQQLVSSSFSRTVTPSLRSFTTFLSNSKPRSSSARHTSKAKFDALEKEIGALKHLLKGGNSTTASADIREFVLIYEGSSKQYLRGMLKDLQREKSARQEEKTALLSKAAVESTGTLRWNSN